MKPWMGTQKHFRMPGPHRELAIVVRQTYADIENVMLLIDIFKNELSKYSENIQ